MGDVTAVIVNLNTVELTKIAVESLVRAYPDIALILIDNGSVDGTTQYLQEHCSDREKSRALFLHHNIGHGPALHLATNMIGTPYFFTMDSDCEVRAPGFLESMIQYFDDGSVYAVGDLLYVRSEDAEDPSREFRSWPTYVPYISPHAGLYRMSFYRTTYPFMHHGAPLLWNMIGARSRGWMCISFPIQEYVAHLRAGTRKLYDASQREWNIVAGRLPVGW